jgi:hypothetical protein
LKRIPGLQGLWQVHRATGASAEANTFADLMANLTAEDDQGYWIKATVDASGDRYTLTNGRNNYSQPYSTK